jgi:peptidoglycan/xylan/chitin deacetylase (PgdA/CDA1 family)
MGWESMRHALGGYRPDRLAYRGAVRGRMCAERSLLAARSRIAPAQTAARRGRILSYHSVGTPQWGLNDVSPRDFERHLQIAVDEGWSFATPAEVLAEPDKPQLALTFDDGLTSVLTNAVPVLRHHGVPATVFVVTGWADQTPPGCQGLVLDWPGIRTLGESGLSLASHSVTHPDFAKLGPAEARRELEESRERIHQVLGIWTDEFAIPLGQSANWTQAAAEAAAGAGYTTVYAQAVNTRPAGTAPRTFITRIDMPLLFRAALAGAYDNWEEWY